MSWSRKKAVEVAVAPEVKAEEPKDPHLMLGRYVEGEAALPVAGGLLSLPVSELRHHLVILGQSGAGKTETALRLAYELAKESDDQIIYLDAKGSRKTARRFVGLMEEAGRSTRVFPNEPMDLWRGSWRAILNRLLEVVAYAPQGPASYYRDVAKVVLQLACHHPAGPPRSSAEFLSRLDPLTLSVTYPDSSALRAVMSRDQGALIDQVRMRYEAFFGQLGRAFDGDWGFEDVDAAYMLLDPVSLGEDAASSAVVIFNMYADHFKNLKAEGKGCLLAVDEFSAIARTSDVAMKIEQARESDAAMILMPQSVAGMGDDEQSDRILGAIGTVMTHQSGKPEAVSALAGTKKVSEVTSRLAEDNELEGVNVRKEEVPKLHPDSVRDLERGEAWVIRGGRCGQVAVTRAPVGASGELPPEADLYDEPVPPVPPVQPVPSGRSTQSEQPVPSEQPEPDFSFLDANPPE